jgi:predicted RNase H-like HicB family nuclease
MKTVYVIIEKTDTGWSAFLLDINGVVSTGATINELKSNMEDAYKLYLQGLNDDNFLDDITFAEELHYFVTDTLPNFKYFVEQ